MESLRETTKRRLTNYKNSSSRDRENYRLPKNNDDKDADGLSSCCAPIPALRIGRLPAVPGDPVDYD